MALSEEQLELLGNRLVPLYQKFERAVINDVVRRLVKTERLTETAEIMAKTLRDKGFSPAAIRAQVMKAINADKKLQEAIAVNTLEMKQLILDEIKMLRENARTESEQMWEDAGNMAFHEDLSVWEQGAKPVKGSAFEQIVRATSKRATDELLNLTKSLGFRTADGLNVRAERIFTHEMNMAFVKLSSGAYSYGQAIDEAVRDMARSGIRHVDFDSGVTRQLDTAVRNAVMTASAQLAGEITMHNVEQTGVEYVEVSAHWGAREGEGHANHAGWQGRIYCVKGDDGQYENLEKATGYPSDPTGLCGYNCRHTFYPFWPGISEPNEWPPEPGPFDVDGRTYTYYQATQEQRRREREIRALKREEAAYEAAGLKDKAKEAARKIKIRTADYKEFSNDLGIRAKTERLRVCEGLKSDSKSGIINSRGEGMAIKTPIEQRNTGKGNPSAMLHFDRPLNNRQTRLLERLPEYDSRTTVPKKEVNMRDLAALTAHTGVEYALFTRKGERLIIRGSEYMTNIDTATAMQMSKEGWRWSGHTHPGTDINACTASSGDYAVLEAFGQKYSLIYSAAGKYELFGGE